MSTSIHLFKMFLLLAGVTLLLLLSYLIIPGERVLNHIEGSDYVIKKYNLLLIEQETPVLSSASLLHVNNSIVIEMGLLTGTEYIVKDNNLSLIAPALLASASLQHVDDSNVIETGLLAGTDNILKNNNLSLIAPTLPSAVLLPANNVLCVHGHLYGQFNNQFLAVNWAMMLARRQQQTLIRLEGGGYLARNWNGIFGEVPGVIWHSNPSLEKCNRKYTWADMFMDMLQNRPQVPIQEWPLLLPVARVREEAERIWKTFYDQGLKKRISLHGRSFEGAVGQCISSDHAGYKCQHHYYMCDYSKLNILSRFSSSIEQQHRDSIVLFSDGQNQEYAQTYHHQETSAPLEVQMWMMATSDIHIGHPGSSQDYVVWRWRQEINPRSIMLPLECYHPP